MSYPILESYGFKFGDAVDDNTKSEIKDLFKEYDDVDETIDYIRDLNKLVVSFNPLLCEKNAKDILRALSILIHHIYKHSVVGHSTTDEMIDDFKGIFMEIINNPVYSMLCDNSEKKSDDE